MVNLDKTKTILKNKEKKWPKKKRKLNQRKK